MRPKLLLNGGVEQVHTVVNLVQSGVASVEQLHLGGQKLLDAAAFGRHHATLWRKSAKFCSAKAAENSAEAEAEAERRRRSVPLCNSLNYLMLMVGACNE